MYTHLNAMKCARAAARIMGAGLGAAVLSLPLAAFATTQQPLLGGTTGNLSTTLTQHGNLGIFSALATALNNSYVVAPAGGTLSGFIVALTAAPGVGTTRIFTVEKNLSATGITCTIADTATTCTDTTHTLSIAAGDVLSWSSALTGTPAAATAGVSIIFTPTVDNTTMILSRSLTTVTGSAGYAPLSQGGVTSWNATESTVADVFPDTGTFTSFYYSSNTAPGSTKSYVWALRKNTSSTALTCTVSGTAGFTCNDTTHTATVAPGDSVDYLGTPNQITTGMGIAYTSNTPGAFVFLGSTFGGTDSASAVNYIVPNGDRATTGVEGGFKQVAPMAFTMNKMYVSTTAPGGSATRTFTLRVNGSNSALACTISAASTSCTASGAIAINTGDILSISDLPSGTPATGNPVLGLVGRVTPPFQSTILGGLLRIFGGSVIIR